MKLIAQFGDTTLPLSQFHHAEHLQIALCYAMHHGPEDALNRMSTGLQRYLQANRIPPEKYSAAVTAAWMERIQQFLSHADRAHPFEVLRAQLFDQVRVLPVKLGGAESATMEKIPKEHSLSLRAVIFDYGMVLSAPADPSAHQELIRIFGAPAAAFEEQYWAHRHAYDAGALDGPAFWQTCAEGAGVALTPSQVQELIATDIRMWSSINQTMVDWALALGRAGIRIGVLSNIGLELVPALKETHSFLASFDHCTWSCDLRLAKPDPAIYLHTLEQLRVEAGEALFLDDRKENVAAARSLGIDAILFENPAQLHHELEARGLAHILPPVALALPSAPVAQ